jgi:DNA-binding NtrC family response regulator
MEDSLVKFSDEYESNPVGFSDPLWNVMVVDDEKSIHDITTTVLRGFEYDRKGINLINAYSGRQMIAFRKEHPETALIILDIVIETQGSGLHFVQHVRNELKNDVIQIVIRTGQPDLAPKDDVISKYHINSYYSKTGLKAHKIISLATASLRAYNLSKMYKQELKKRKKSEAELKQLNKDFEEKIKVRTKEPVRANKLKN